jgi:PTH1 family peptidyl-tRNA hydrolase
MTDQHYPPSNQEPSGKGQASSKLVERYLVAGLGNPGRQYRETRHNIGFMLADRMAKRLDYSFSKVQMRALVIDLRYNERRVLLVKPQTYMNDSGISVGALMKFYKIPLQNMLIAHDDVDLPFGTLRLRPGGSSAGQKGVASIIDRLGTQDFARLRLGVGRPPGNKLAAAYVLQNFSREENEIMPLVLDKAVDAVLTFLTENLNTAMNKYNGQEIIE